ncbi:MAG: hypothetical protein R3E94_03930 [Burkholderiaceae bacterium]
MSNSTLNDLLNLLSASSSDGAHCREIAEMAPIFLVASVAGLLSLHVFYSFNYQAAVMGGVAGVASALGHLGLAAHNRRMQYFSLVLLVVSVLFFPSSPKPLFGLLALSGVISGVGLFSAVFVLLSLLLSWRKNN